MLSLLLSQPKSSYTMVGLTCLRYPIDVSRVTQPDRSLRCARLPSWASASARTSYLLPLTTLSEPLQVVPPQLIPLYDPSAFSLHSSALLGFRSNSLTWPLVWYRILRSHLSHPQVALVASHRHCLVARQARQIEIMATNTCPLATERAHGYQCNSKRCDRKDLLG